jgi:hypothetical protein
LFFRFKSSVVSERFVLFTCRVGSGWHVRREMRNSALFHRVTPNYVTDVKQLFGVALGFKKNTSVIHGINN